MPWLWKIGMVVLVLCLVASMVIAIVPPRDDADRNPRRRLPRPARPRQPPALVSAAFSDRAEEAGVFKRIVVGTDGSETASEAVARRSTWPSSPAPRSASSAPTRRSQRAGSSSEQADAPADVQYEIGPREDVNLILETPSPRPQDAGVRGPAPPGRGGPGRGDPQGRRADQGRPDRGRQQGHGGRPALPARQRAQQGLPSRTLQRDHHSHHLDDARRRSAPGLRAGEAGELAGRVGARWPRRSGRHPAAAARGRAARGLFSLVTGPRSRRPSSRCGDDAAGEHQRGDPGDVGRRHRGADVVARARQSGSRGRP